MRSTRQQAIKTAVCTVLAAIGLLASGCDDRAADRKAIAQFEKGDWKAAASETDASPAIQTIAAGRAADDQLAKALPTYRDIAANQIMISDAMWYLSRLATSAGQISSSSISLAKYDPAAALATLDKAVQDVKGEGKAAWSPANLGVEMPTLSALTARSNQLRDQMTEIQRNIAELKQKQQTLVQSSTTTMDQSKAQQGEKSVELFKQSADARKQAAQVGVQVDQAEASLVPLQQELAVVQEQIQIAGDAMNIMIGHRADIEKSWRGITAQADQRANYVQAIFAKGTPERSGSIVMQAERLAKLVAEQDNLATKYEQQLQEAVASAKSAVSSSEKAIREAQPVKTNATKAANPNDLFKLAVDPSTARFTQGNIEYSLGTHQAGRAAMMSSRARAVEGVAEIARQIKQQLPEGLDSAAIKAEAVKVAADASANLTSAKQLFDNAAEAQGPAATKRSASIGQMVTLHASSLLASTQGDAAIAKQNLDEAKAIRDRLMETGEPLPSLPASLQGAPSATAPSGAAVERQ